MNFGLYITNHSNFCCENLLQNMSVSVRLSTFIASSITWKGLHFQFLTFGV